MARKSKGFGELLHQQRMHQVEQRGLEKLQQKMQQGELRNQFAGTIANPKGEVKMSEVLEEFVEPYLDAAHNHSQREKLFSIAIIAWNLAILPESDRQSMINKFLKEALNTNDPLTRQDTKGILDELIARKQKFFANNQRLIVDFELQDTGSSFHLSVASMLSRPAST